MGTWSLLLGYRIAVGTGTLTVIIRWVLVRWTRKVDVGKVRQEVLPLAVVNHSASGDDRDCAAKKRGGP